MFEEGSLVGNLEHVSALATNLTCSWILNKTISPFSHPLGSNYAASAAETSQIWQIVSQLDNDIARIDKQIDWVPNISDIGQLQRFKDEIVISLQAHKVLISPVQLTPSELWAKIFVLCVSEDEFVEISALKAPLLLGQICSHWRDIALSTPALWNSIRLGAWERLGLPLVKMPLIKAWLGRSGNLPLSIQIYHSKAATPTLIGFLDILIPFSSRWYKLDLWLSQSLVEKLVCNSDLPIPSLTSLS